MAPVDKPRLVVSVFLGEPKSGWRFGSLAAAPVFSKIVGDSLVLLRD
jgi:cell division protein FtsI/penicillin-binding protein 2